MIRTVSRLVAGVASAAMVLSLGITSASAADATITVKVATKPVVSTTGVVGLDGALSATASVAGKVDFLVDGVAVVGCSAVATSATAPFTAVCSPWTPAKGGVSVNLTAVLTPTDATLAKVTSPIVAHIIGQPINEKNMYPISMYVDTIVASGANDKTKNQADKASGYAGIVATGKQPYLNNAGCSITNYFVQGQTMVWRVYANDASDGGVVLTDKNATVTLTVAGIKDPIKLAYGDHSGQSFWTAPVSTGPTGLYNTLGVVNWTITVARIAEPAVTHEATSIKYVKLTKKGKPVKVDGKYVWVPKTVKTTVVDKPAVLSTTQGVYSPAWVSTNSQVTLAAVPTA